MLGLVFVLGVRIAAPVVVVLLLVELALGLLARVAPSLNVMIAGAPVRLAVGLLVVAATRHGAAARSSAATCPTVLDAGRRHGAGVPVTGHGGQPAGDRTEKPTAKRMKDARERGQVARSRDLARRAVARRPSRSRSAGSARGWSASVSDRLTGGADDARRSARAATIERQRSPALDLVATSGCSRRVAGPPAVDRRRRVDRARASRSRAGVLAEGAAAATGAGSVRRTGFSKFAPDAGRPRARSRRSSAWPPSAPSATRFVRELLRAGAAA